MTDSCRKISTIIEQVFYKTALKIVKSTKYYIFVQKYTKFTKICHKALTIGKFLHYNNKNFKFWRKNENLEQDNFICI